MRVLGAILVILGFLVPVPAQATTVTFNSWPKDVIYVYDMTANVQTSIGTQLWPVRYAANWWSKDNPVNFVYRTTPCPSGSQCVTVKQAELAAPTVGVTATARVGTDIRSSTITLDTTFGRTNNAARRRNVICHELGHSLGLGHRAAPTNSCLTSYVTDRLYPDATDLATLRTRYGYR